MSSKSWRKNWIKWKMREEKIFKLPAAHHQLTMTTMRLRMLLHLSDAFGVRCFGKNHDWPCCCLHMIKSTTACGLANKYFGIWKKSLEECGNDIFELILNQQQKSLDKKRAEREENWYCHKINLPSANIASRYLLSEQSHCRRLSESWENFAMPIIQFSGSSILLQRHGTHKFS